MGPQTIAETLSTMSPMIWTCGGGVVLIVVIYRLLIKPLLDD